MLPARVMLAYIFIHGAGAIADYAGTVGYMQTNGVDARLLPLVILTELGGGLLVLFGLKVRWAAIAFCGFSLLTAFLIHLRANEMIGLQKNVAMAGGSLALAVFGPEHGRSMAGAGAKHCGRSVAIQRGRSRPIAGPEPRPRPPLDQLACGADVVLAPGEQIVHFGFNFRRRL
jgi:putative oxidoreductase